MLHQAGWIVNVKRVERIWRREGLKVPGKQTKRGRLWLNDSSCIRLRPEYPNHVWQTTLGGRPAATIARRLMVPISNDILLRVVRRRGTPRFVPSTVIGIDDWAWQRNQRYGTIICDLERRKTIALLPDREPAIAQAWLSDQ